MSSVLVVFGSKLGGTAQIAAQVGDALRELGLAVDVRPARDVRDVTPYDAVLVGGALYAARWHADARRFVLRHARALRERSVWCFSSGPLDDSATRREILPTPQVQELMDYVGARGHATFGGRLAPDARGFLASSMAKTRAGDYRDAAQIAGWAQAIGRRLLAEQAHPEARPARPAPRPLPSRLRPVAQCLLAGVTAVGGGAALVARPDGTAIQLPLSVLAHSPFTNFLIPGLLLLVVVGLGNVYAAVEHLRRSDTALFASFVSGMGLTIWMVVEMIMLRSAHALQLAFLVLGLAIVQDAVARMRRAFAPARGGRGDDAGAGGSEPAPSRA